MNLHGHALRHICVSKFRKAKRVARARQAVLDRDRVFRRPEKMSEQFRKVRQLPSHALRKIAKWNYRSFPVPAAIAAFLPVAKLQNHLLRKVYSRLRSPAQ